MKAMVLYPHPPEPDGVSMQGHYLIKGLQELGVEVIPCDREDSLEKIWMYKALKPDFVIGIGYWANMPELVFSPQRRGLAAIPWFNADGWVANYHKELNELPLIVTTSNWVRETYIRDGMNGGNIKVCPIGFDPNTFYPWQKDDKRRKELREILGVEDDEILIFTAGGDATSKGAQEVIKALAEINKKFQRWKYILKVYESFSAEDHGIEEERLIKDLGLDRNKIRYLTGKFSPEFMASLLNACDIYAAPSRLEGFGMIQVEAQACGKPVISINIGGPTDTVVHGKTGFLVDIGEEIKLKSEWAYDWMGFEDKHKIVFNEPKTFAYRANTAQLANYTMKLIENSELREQMGRAAAESTLKNFHYKVTAEKMLNLIKDNVLKNKN